AGFSVSEETGEIATLVKLIRVTMLAPVVLLFALSIRAMGQETTEAGWKAVFEGVSDTTTISRWSVLRSISYHVKPAASGSILRVSLACDRLLSPSWAFAPMMMVAAQLTISVLATETNVRAEGVS
ncbi:MAG: putative sulfate exporter family transporter, partial [Pseudomonadota bacterium]